MKKLRFGATLATWLVVLLALAGCGGGGGTSTLTPTPAPPAAKTVSGTAAAGAPIIGSVTIKDSATPANTETVPIAADGKYSVDVSDPKWKAPFAVRADGYVGGNEYHLYSAATQEDVGHTINITPLTDLIVANIAGSIAKTYFDSGNFSTLTAEKLTAETAKLQEKLKPVLQAIGLSDSIDLLRASFSTDHTGLDAALDVIKVSVDPATQVAIIKNVITQQQITSNLAQGSYSGTLDKTDGVATGVTAIQGIDAQLKKFSDLFATGLPKEDNAALLALFDQEHFMEGGKNLHTFLSERTTDPAMVGIAFTNLVINSINAAQDVAEIEFTVLENGAATSDSDGPGAWQAIKKNGVWLLQGDQRIADVGVSSSAEYRFQNSSTPIISSGLDFFVEDRGNKGIDSAVVTGAGLPAAGIRLIKQISQSWFAIENSDGNVYGLTDADITKIADSGENYTIKLYTGATLTATYTEKLKKRPYKNSELTAASFPAIAAPTAADLAKYTGGNLTVTWTLPESLTADWLTVQLGGSNTDTAMAKYDLKANAASQVVTITTPSFTPSWRWLSLGAWDVYGRKLRTSINVY